jgi:hypothetical protein
MLIPAIDIEIVAKKNQLAAFWVNRVINIRSFVLVERQAFAALESNAGIEYTIFHSKISIFGYS